MTQAQILAAIPHRPPFLLLDEIVTQSEDQIHCRRTLRGDEWFFAGHYPHFPLTPGVLLCEACLQAGAVLLAQFPLGGGVPVATRMNEVRFKRMVRPGETIDIHVTLQERLSNAFFLQGKVSCDGQVAARLEFAVTVAAVDRATESPAG